MATIALQYPTLSPGAYPMSQTQTLSFNVFAGNTVHGSSLTIADPSHNGYVSEPALSAGTTPYNTGGRTLIGLSMFNSNKVFVSPSGATAYNTPFGVYTNTGTALVPNTPSSLKVAIFNGNQFQFSLDTAIALTQSLVGSSIGLASTGSSNGDIWYATTTNVSSCLCATVVEIVQGPGYGVTGTDSGGRLVLEFLPAFLAV